MGSPVFTGANVSLDNQGFARLLPVLAAQLGVLNAVEFTGETEDLRSIYESLDVLLVPSWEEPLAGSSLRAWPLASRSRDKRGWAGRADRGRGKRFPRLSAADQCRVDPVLRLLQNAELSRRIGTSARERITTLLVPDQRSTISPSFLGQLAVSNRRLLPQAGSDE